MINHNAFPAGGPENPGTKAMAWLIRVTDPKRLAERVRKSGAEPNPMPVSGSRGVRLRADGACLRLYQIILRIL